MLKCIFLELLRWSLRFHSFFHLIHIYQDIYRLETPNWEGVYLSLYMIFVELMSSFFIPKEHIHFKALKSDVHENCDD